MLESLSQMRTFTTHFTKTTHHHSWAKEISNQSAVRSVEVQMAKAAQTHAKIGLHTKKLQPNALKALLEADTAEQGFSFL